MPKRRRRLPGRYQPKPAPDPDTYGLPPFSVFEGENGLWGVKDSTGRVIEPPEWHRAEQTEAKQREQGITLVQDFAVLYVYPDSWYAFPLLSGD
ncbi:MAG: hypothetical protein HXN14_06850 [Porphyromonadaceae bacterium]|nr:hypothetical protein [Porphyromonadaceae bacterium]